MQTTLLLLEEVKAAVVLDQPNLLWIASRFAFMERLVYWFTGLNIFSQSPWIGVGLGNVGYHFAQQVPSMGWTSFEIREIFYRLSSFPNTKSLWVRLLAESGLLGFSIFLGWLYTLWRSTRMTAHSHELGLKTLSLSGQLFLIALIAEGFSVDSFAMPYIWVMTGIISAAGMQYRSSVNLRPAPSGIQEKDTS